MTLDTDLDALSRDQLIGEVRRLRAAIRTHRDATGHDLCWYQPKLWALLPEQADPRITIPKWEQFMHGCVKFRASLDRQAPDAPRTDEVF